VDAIPKRGSSRRRSGISDGNRRARRTSNAQRHGVIPAALPSSQMKRVGRFVDRLRSASDRRPPTASRPAQRCASVGPPIDGSVAAANLSWLGVDGSGGTAGVTRERSVVDGGALPHPVHGTCLPSTLAGRKTSSRTPLALPLMGTTCRPSHGTKCSKSRCVHRNNGQRTTQPSVRNQRRRRGHWDTSARR
jgi:hypothetical protein